MINSIVDGTITVVLFLPELNLAQAQVVLQLSWIRAASPFPYINDDNNDNNKKQQQ